MRAVIVTGQRAEDWQEADLEPTLKTYQAVVGGLIEALPIRDEATVYLNESGKLLNLPATALWTDEEGRFIDGICGPLVIVGPHDDEGDASPLTDQALAYAKKVLHPIVGEPRSRLIVMDESYD